MKPLRKSKYIKVYTYHENKTLTLEYVKIANFPKTILINPNHIYMSNGFQSIIKTSTSAETINPLDFSSKYDAKKFESAIESKIIKETFGNLDTGKLDIMKVLLFVNIGINLVLLYILLKNSGAI